MVVRAVDWNDPMAERLRSEMESDLAERYADLFAERPELIEDDDNTVHPEAVVLAVVAEIAGAEPGSVWPAGCATLVRRADGDLEVKRLYVRPSSRRRGVSRALLLALEEHAKTLGAHGIVLSTGPRQPEAVALYEAIGYTRRDPYGATNWQDIAIFFEKAL